MNPKSCKPYIANFSELLKTVEVSEISTELYPQNYLRHIIQHAEYYLHIYAELLNIVIEKSGKQISEITLLDLGTGNGLLALFAKYCGCKKVYGLDIDKNFIHAAKNLAEQLHLDFDGFINADIETFSTQPESNHIDAVVGTDMIEHVYDLHSFFSSLQKMKSVNVTVFSTASNPLNVWKCKQLKRIQYRDEYEGYSGNELDSAAHLSFYALRKEIIHENFPYLKKEVLERLTKATRGLKREDIIKATHTFIQSGNLPEPLDAHNTCHPINGSWTERLLSLETYQQLHHQYGYDFEWHSGFYNSYTKGLKRIVNRILNMLVKRWGGKVSPFIIWVGFKK